MKKWYVVWKGRRPGMYTTWDETKRQVDGFAGARFKSFPTRAAAEAAFQRPAPVYAGAPQAAEVRKPSAELLDKLGECYAVDAACSGNPGRLEYRCVHVPTGRTLFERGPFPQGTNNIGEFLALVEALMLFKGKAITAPLYSDSKIALGWLKARQCKTQLPETGRNQSLFDSIQRAEAWLRDNTYTNRVLKWDTEDWGENPADFGRK